MFGLSWLEIAFFALTAGGIAVAAIGLGRAKEFQTPLAIFIASIMIPLVGPTIALGYGAYLLIQSRRRDESGVSA